MPAGWCWEGPVDVSCFSDIHTDDVFQTDDKWTLIIKVTKDNLMIAVAIQQEIVVSFILNFMLHVNWRC